MINALLILLVVCIPGLGFLANGRRLTALLAVLAFVAVLNLAAWSWSVCTLSGFACAALAAWCVVQPACMAIEARRQAHG